MEKKIILTKRDYTLFNDLSRFGFTSTEHFALRFSCTTKKASKRLIKLAKHNYLKALGRSNLSGKLIYLPAGLFYKICPYREVQRFNINSLSHDEYVLMIFCLFKRNDYGEKILLEQDIKKNNSESKMYSRIPDLILYTEEKNYVFEYERSLKSESQYRKIFAAYKYEDDDSNHFVFLCESRIIAKKISEMNGLQKISLLNPWAFLKALKENKYEKLIHYLQDKTLIFF